jgi:hypothetical protein
MPMPKRKRGESEKDFVARFMGDPTMRKDYPDRDQRLAVALQEARKRKDAAIHKAIDSARAELRKAWDNDLDLLDEPILKRFVLGREFGLVDLYNLADSGYDGIEKWASDLFERLEEVTELQSDVFKADVTICKVSEDQRLVYAWASVVEEGGQAVVDAHGDTIGESDLVKAAHGSLRRIVGKEMHEGGQVAEIVESMVFTKEVQALLGVDLGKVGWFVAMKIHDADVWTKVKDGTYRALSIGGRGLREEIA